MNVFYVHPDPVIAARSLCDKHVVKMILESAQMLSTAHHLLDVSVPEVFYRPTHKNHPCSVWARSNTANYLWLYVHFSAMCDEYTHRYGRTHLTSTKLGGLLKHPPAKAHQSDWPTPVPLCMPDEFKGEGPVESYRAYYRSKNDLMKMVWTEREAPEWFHEQA